MKLQWRPPQLELGSGIVRGNVCGVALMDVAEPVVQTVGTYALGRAA